jgi:hypothetical protein
MSDELISVSDAAKKLGVSARTVQRYCKQGILDHKWVHGTRHRELRIVPPIPLSLLPGVKRGSAPDNANLATKQEFEELLAMLTGEIALRDQRIENLEREIARLTGSQGFSTPSPFENDRLERVESLLDEYERIRPVERKLILKLARTVKEQEEFLRTLGLPVRTDISGE